MIYWRIYYWLHALYRWAGWMLLQYFVIKGFVRKHRSIRNAMRALYRNRRYISTRGIGNVRRDSVAYLKCL